MDPLATWTTSGNWTSIFGSYSPITPEREMQMSISAKSREKKKLCFWRLTRAKQLWQENYIKTQVVALRCCCSECEPISSRLQTSGYELKCFFDFQCSAIGAAETLPALSAVSHWKEWVRNTAFQWTCNTLMLNGKKTQKKTTLRIHRRFELLHPDEFHLVVVLTAMNQKMGP